MTTREVLEGLLVTCRHTGMAKEEAALSWVLGGMLPPTLKHLLERPHRHCERCQRQLKEGSRGLWCGEACRQAAFRERRKKTESACPCGHGK